MLRRTSMLALILLAGCAGILPASSPDAPIYSYVRSNSDGSEAEAIHIFQPRADRIEVYKMRERCTNAAYVTAEIDPATGQARRLMGGRLRPGATQEAFAEMTYDPGAKRIDAELRADDGVIRDSVDVPDTPWHLYDFDLATLNVALMAMPDPRAGFSFGVPLVLVGDDIAKGFLTYLGRADVRFVRAERHDGRPALRFEVGGPAFGAKGGPLWIDARDHHILEARWGVSNHAEYRDFQLKLAGVDAGGAPAWHSLLSRHFECCQG